ncbi:MAG TPA: DUF2147 domain-containing protein [Pseudolabrys sp.]|nr:DUF2147 domain-containing protein [Pseudolabrys sp.]
MRPLFSLAALGAVLLLSASPARAADPTGQWITQNGKAHVLIGKCGDALCGSIISLKEPIEPATGKPKTDKNNADASKRSRPVIGVHIVLGMKPAGDGLWKGEVYNAEDGKTYSGNLTFTGGSSLKLEGCALGGLICKTQTWTRAN